MGSKRPGQRQPEPQLRVTRPKLELEYNGLFLYCTPEWLASQRKERDDK